LKSATVALLTCVLMMPAPSAHADGEQAGRGNLLFGTAGDVRFVCRFERYRYGFRCTPLSPGNEQSQSNLNDIAATLARGLNRKCDALLETPSCVRNPARHSCKFVRYEGMPVPLPC
jgi:hypothetical protein